MNVVERVKSDLAYLRGALRMLSATRAMAKDPSRTVNHLFEELVAQFGDREALNDGDSCLNYRQMGARADLYAWLAYHEGYGKGDVIALLMPNRADFVCVWQGFAKRGVVTALINTSLVGGALRQCIEVVKPLAIVVDPSLWPQFAAVRDGLSPTLRVYTERGPADSRDISALLAEMPNRPLPEEGRPKLTSLDPCLYIYTSGTTGLPKAANLNHYRIQLTMLGFAAAADSNPHDRVYDCLPMHHTVGGICALGIALVRGGTLVIRQKFSAGTFWTEVGATRCTIVAYVGELCRYLINQQSASQERSHRVRIAFGNGLRPDIFTPFRDRFGIPRILEFYAATESNVGLFNFDSRAGSVGRLPWWMRFKFTYSIVQYDVEVGQVRRGPDGLCIPCKPGEPGEMLGQILDDPSKPSARFEGYADKEAGARKVLRDVFAKGDRWFSTGDLLFADRRGYHYFVDRTGDTFRWKGENVSTTQVAEVVCSFGPVRDATVYGVSVPGHEGRAGMAAIVCDVPDTFDLAAFRDHLAADLPEYAWPLFLRFPPTIAATSTFKSKKNELASEGFRPHDGTKVFVYDAAERRFRLFDQTQHNRLLEGQLPSLNRTDRFPGPSTSHQH